MIGPVASASLAIRKKLKGTLRDAPAQLAGTVLIDVSLANDTTTAVAPAWHHLTFTTINSGTAGTVNGNGDLVLNVSGTGYVNVVQDVQISTATTPYLVYLMWNWNGKQVYLGAVSIPDNQEYTLTTSGLISLGGSPLGLYIATNLASQTLTNSYLDFQLLTPTSLFPALFPSLPTPVGADQPIPTFPPPTPPPIGHVPVGEFAYMDVQPGPVGISVAGIVQPVFRTGSATSPTAASFFPSFTATFPNPPITVSNVWTIPTLAGGVWTTHLPPSIVTTANITLNGWGPPGPSGLGPGPPQYPNPPGAGKPQMAEAGTEETQFTEPPPAEPERAEVSTAAGSTGETLIFPHEDESEIHEHHQRRRRKRHV